MQSVRTSCVNWENQLRYEGTTLKQLVLRTYLYRYIKTFNHSSFKPAASLLTSASHQVGRVLGHCFNMFTSGEWLIVCYVITVKLSELKTRISCSLGSPHWVCVCRLQNMMKTAKDIYISIFPITVMFQSHKSWRVKRCFIRKSYDVLSH